MRRLLRLSLVLVFAALSAGFAGTASADEKTTIHRDQFGIPHIFASTVEDAAFAVGYAQAEDRLEELLKNYRRANGEMAEVFGPSELIGDIAARLARHAEVSRERYNEVSPKVRGIVEAYQRGVKKFMRDHPEQVPPWAQEIHPWDAVAFGRHIIWRWPLGEAVGDLKRIGIPATPQPYLGSNEMLVAPSRTAMNAAVAIVDPHVSWYGDIRFYQVRVYTPEYNASGVCLVGQPLPSLGHSEYCSVAMTTGGPDTADAFALETNPENPLQYRWDDAWRDMDLQTVEIKVKEGDKVETKTMKFPRSHFGPIVGRAGDKAYSVAIPYDDEVGMLDQMYEMFTARNLPEMKLALSRLQLMSQNIMVATIQGDIYYLRNGRVPIRAPGTDSFQPIDGTKSANQWRGIHPIQDLIQIENPQGGWMQNCNCGPESMMKTGAPQEADYADRPHLYAGRGTHQRSEMVNDLLDSADKLTTEQAIEIAFSTQVWRAELWQKRIQDAWRQATESDKAGETARVVDQIAKWNRHSNPDSVGAASYYAFKVALGGKAAEQTEPPADLTDAQILDALRNAPEAHKSTFGAIDGPFGAYFRVGRRGGDRSWPVGGGSLKDVGMATPRAVSFDPSPDGKQMIGRTGQSATQIVIMTDPPESYSINPLGASDHKESGHWDDQAEKLFSPGKAVPSYFLRPDELMKHVTSTKTLVPEKD